MRNAILSSTLVITLIVFATAGCSESGDIEGVVAIAQDDAEMNAAMKKAGDTIDQFIAALRTAGPDRGGFAIKKGFPTTDPERLEYIWINEIEYDGTFRGLINNDPENIPDMALGDAVTATRDEIVDWMYFEGERMIGGHTIRVLLVREPVEKQRELAEAWGIELE